MLQGGRDPFGSPTGFPSGIDVVVVAGADHSFGVARSGPLTSAEALDVLLEDRERRRRLGAQGRAYVESVYSWPAVTARLRDTLERLLIARSQAGA